MIKTAFMVKKRIISYDEGINCDDNINITNDKICLIDDENDNMENDADDMSDVKHDSDSDPNITEPVRWSVWGSLSSVPVNFVKMRHIPSLSTIVNLMQTINFQKRQKIKR